MIGIAEVAFNINNDAFHFVIHKTIAYRILITSNQSFRANKVGLRPAEIGQTEQKLTPLEERFIQIISRRVAFFTANSLCITSRNCLWYVSLHQNFLEPSPNHMENVQNIDILSFLKTFYDRHCAPYK